MPQARSSILSDSFEHINLYWHRYLAAGFFILVFGACTFYSSKMLPDTASLMDEIANALKMPLLVAAFMSFCAYQALRSFRKTIKNAANMSNIGTESPVAKLGALIALGVYFYLYGVNSFALPDLQDRQSLQPLTWSLIKLAGFMYAGSKVAQKVAGYVHEQI